MKGIRQPSARLLEPTQRGKLAPGETRFAEEDLIGGGYSRQARAALLLHLVEHLFGKHEPVVDYQRRAGHQVRVEKRRSVTVIERQDGHRAVVRTDTGVAEDVLGVYQDVVVSHHRHL